MTMRVFKFSFLTMAVILGGCATQPEFKDPPLFRDGPSLTDPTAEREMARIGDSDSRPEPVIFSGTDRLVDIPKREPVRELQGDRVAISFEKAPITEVVHVILGDVLKLDYSVDRPLQGEITLHTREPVPRDQLLPILESLLLANGALMVPGADGLYHIGPADAVRGVASGVSSVEGMPPGYGTVIVPLRYIGAREMADILRPVAPGDAFVRVDGTRNILMLAGTRSQIEGWMEIVNSFDIDMLQGMSVGIFPIVHAAVDEVVSAVNMLLSNESGEGLSGGAARVMPIERLNSVLVVTPRARNLDTIRTWIERLDRSPENDFEPQLYVYPVQNGNATHLAQLLTSIFDGAGGAGGRDAPGRTDSGVAPGMATSSIAATAGSGGGSVSGTGGSAASAVSTQGDDEQRRQGQGGAASASTGGGAPSSSMAAAPTAGASVAGAAGGSSIDGVSAFGNNVRIVADEINNALLIYAPRRDYRRIERALRALDISPTQVLIEASILEVSLTDELKYGLEWFLEGTLGSGWRGNAELNLNESGGIGPAQPGFSYTVKNPAGAIRAVLTTLAQKSLVRVVSSPSIMVLDNHTANIQVGDQQPVRSSETISDGGNRSTSIQYKDTGVMLSVTPSVNAGGMVSMDLQQSVTDVGNVDQATGQRSFMQREVSSRVAVRSGETVVLGGLIKNNASNARSGIPVLHDLPLVGNLFGTTGVTADRTELLVMITPRVMRDDNDVRAVSREMRSRMMGLQALPGWGKGVHADREPVDSVGD